MAVGNVAYKSYVDTLFGKYYLELRCVGLQLAGFGYSGVKLLIIATIHQGEDTAVEGHVGSGHGEHHQHSNTPQR